MDKLSFDAIPAAKRLDKVDQLDLELERQRKAKEIDLSAYAHTKRALILRRNKEWASVCRAMGWPIEYNPLTRDPESIVKPYKPITAEFELYPDRDDIVTTETPVNAPEDPLERKRRHKHYLIFWCWVLVMLAVYLGLG